MICGRQKPHRGSLHLSVVLLSQERYTCPSLALHPREPVFLAQTNGNYLALFSSVWPYRMSRRRRYEGHKVPHLYYLGQMLTIGPKTSSQAGISRTRGHVDPLGTLLLKWMTSGCVNEGPLRAQTTCPATGRRACQFTYDGVGMGTG